MRKVWDLVSGELSNQRRGDCRQSWLLDPQARNAEALIENRASPDGPWSPAGTVDFPHGSDEQGPHWSSTPDGSVTRILTTEGADLTGVAETGPGGTTLRLAGADGVHAVSAAGRARRRPAGGGEA